MATLSTTNPTLADVTSRMTADGKIDPQIVELLAETNEILEDMTVIEANGFTEHKTTVRSGLPQGTWRMLNYGVQPEKSRTVPVKDSMGMLETYAEVDKADDEVAVGIERPAGADDVVPPADVVRCVGVMAGDVVVAGERVADENGVRLGGVERAVGLVDQIVGRQSATAAQVQRLVEVGAL